MKKTKRILALSGVILLAALYIITLISGLLATPATNALFKACLFSTVAVPVMLYAYMLIYRVLKNRGGRGNEKVPEEKKEPAADGPSSISDAAHMKTKH